MDEPYVPKVNDYVIWDKGEYGSDEGWVYFFCDEYITKSLDDMWQFAPEYDIIQIEHEQQFSKMFIT